MMLHTCVPAADGASAPDGWKTTDPAAAGMGTARMAQGLLSSSLQLPPGAMGGSGSWLSNPAGGPWCLQLIPSLGLRVPCLRLQRSVHDQDSCIHLVLTAN
jgi:hypothetical protein